MRLAVLAVGRLKAGPERELFDRYSDRVSKSGKALHMFGPELFEMPESRAAEAVKRQSDESQQLIKSAGQDARIVVLDERGKDITSRELAELLKSEQDLGTGTLAFAIGGPDGHGEEIKSAAIRKIRLGAMTWPHQIARILLVEQLYRAITILSGHPYHRD